MTSKYNAVFSCSLLLLAFAATAVQHKTSKPAPAAKHTGEVSGFIFLITRGGDLKPARLAQVYLFRSDLAEAYDVTVVKQRSVFEEGLPPDTELRCETKIRVYDLAIQSALKAARDQDASDAYHILEADEEGRFQFKNVEPADYEILVRGRAGGNDAYWSKSLHVDAGKVTQIKLSEPVVACLNLGD
jgi:hypothetical protein